MAVRNKLSSVDRVIALSLGVIWLGMGVAGLVLGMMRGLWILVALALFAIWYGVLWFRVAARSRKLTPWRELIMPWRAQ
jgi:Flp pilus assembly protein TadB